jgi:hypothetical protein
MVFIAGKAMKERKDAAFQIVHKESHAMINRTPYEGAACVIALSGGDIYG